RPEDAEDVLQTVFLRLLRRGAPPDLQKNPKGYLYRAAVNLSLTTIQSRRRHVLTGDMESFESPANTAAAGPHDEMRRRLSEALARLNPRAVEMRAQSELLLERADDGVRIRLNRGGVIVS